MPHSQVLHSHILLTSLLVLSAASALAAASKSTGVNRGLLLVANKGDHNVSIIDPETGKQLATVDEGGITGHELTASPDGRFAYVPIYGNSGVGAPGTDGTHMIVVDLQSRQVTGNVDFGHGVRPHLPVVGPRDGMLYVTTELDQSVTIVDPKTLKIVGSIPTGQPESHMLAITRDGKRGFTSNVGPGTVSALDLDGRKTIAVIPVSKQAQRISLSVDDTMAFTADQTKPQLAVIDTATNKVKAWIPLPGTGYGTAATHDGRWLLVCSPKTNQIAVVDLKSMKVARTIDVPATPQEVMIRPDGEVAYVSCDASGKVAAISIADWKVLRIIGAGKAADGLAWASLP